MATKRTLDRLDSRVGSQSIAGTACSPDGLRRQKIELHSLLDEDGKMQVEVVWQSMKRAGANQRIKKGVFAIAQLDGEDRPSFVERANALICEFEVEHR
jgi:hypothetical protein